MSNSQPSAQNRRFLALASLIIVLTAGLAASSWPAVLAYGRGQSARLSAAGDTATGDQARLNYRLAYMLNPNNQAAAISVAAGQQAAGEPQAALKTLNGVGASAMLRAGESRGADRVRIKAALEVGKTAAALVAANRLAAPGATDDDLVLSALAFGVAGDSARINALTARVTAPQALQSILKAKASKLTLAVALHATGLPLSSRRILEASEASVPRNLLLASLIKANGLVTDLPTLTKLYRGALQIDPTNTLARSELIANLRTQKDNSAADTQQKQLDRLNSGKP